MIDANVHVTNTTDEAQRHNLASSYQHFNGFFGWKDLNLKYICASEHTAKMLGFKSNARFFDGHLEDTQLQCRAAELVDEFETQDLQVINTQKSLRILKYIRYADDWKVLIGEKHPVLDDNGALKAVSSTAIDITQTNLAVMNFDLLLSEHRSIAGPTDQFCYVLGHSYETDTQLTPRQSEVVFYLLRGKTAKLIALKLGISFRTVQMHTNTLKLKFKCHSQTALVEKLMSLGYHKTCFILGRKSATQLFKVSLNISFFGQTFIYICIALTTHSNCRASTLPPKRDWLPNCLPRP